MQALALLGALRSLEVNNIPMLNTLSRPDVTTKLGGVRVLLIAVFIYPAVTEIGLPGIAGVIVGTTAIVAPIRATGHLNW